MWKMFIPTAIVVAGILTGCGDGTHGSDGTVRTESAAAPSEDGTPTTAVTTTSAAPSTSTAPAPVASSDCDEHEVLAAIAASEAADPGGDITYLRCQDGYGWATYRLASLDESAFVLLSVAPGSYRVLELGTSVCALDYMPADVAIAIAPDDPDVALDCE